jgi:hypothetical protein
MGPVVGGFLVSFLDFHFVFVAAAVVALVSAAFGLAVHESGGAVRRTGPAKFTFALTRLDLLPAEYRLTYLVLIIGTFAAFVRMQTQSSLMPLLMVTQLGYTETDRPCSSASWAR